MQNTKFTFKNVIMVLFTVLCVFVISSGISNLKFIQKSFVSGDTVEGTDNTTSFFDSSPKKIGDYYIIENKDHLVGLANDISKGRYYNGNHSAYLKYKLANDIDFNGSEFSSLGNYEKWFMGEFDGDNHTIKNITLGCNDNGSNFYSALLSQIGGSAIIKNIILENVSFNECDQDTDWSCTGYRSPLVARAHGNSQILNCTVKNSDYSDKTKLYRKHIGGICGYFAGDKIENCTNLANMTDITIGALNNEMYMHIGGIVGQADNGDILNCHNFGNISYSFLDQKGNDNKSNAIDAINNNSNSSVFVGGICGYANINSNNREIMYCSNQGNLNSFQYAGGILAKNSYSDNNILLIQECYNKGSVTAGTNDAPFAYAAGIMGVNNHSCISYCYNLGQVSAFAQAKIVESTITPDPEQKYDYSGNNGTGSDDPRQDWIELFGINHYGMYNHAYIVFRTEVIEVPAYSFGICYLNETTKTSYKVNGSERISNYINYCYNNANVDLADAKNSTVLLDGNNNSYDFSFNTLNLAFYRIYVNFAGYYAYSGSGRVPKKNKIKTKSSGDISLHVSSKAKSLHSAPVCNIVGSNDNEFNVSNCYFLSNSSYPKTAISNTYNLGHAYLSHADTKYNTTSNLGYFVKEIGEYYNCWNGRVEEDNDTQSFWKYEEEEDDDDDTEITTLTTPDYFYKFVFYKNYNKYDYTWGSTYKNSNWYAVFSVQCYYDDETNKIGFRVWDEVAEQYAKSTDEGGYGGYDYYANDFVDYSYYKANSKGDTKNDIWNYNKYYDFTDFVPSYSATNNGKTITSVRFADGESIYRSKYYYNMTDLKDSGYFEFIDNNNDQTIDDVVLKNTRWDSVNSFN